MSTWPGAVGLVHGPEVTLVVFPMYTVAVDVVLKMTKVEAHEVLKARNELVIFHDQLGKAAFVSHQWVAVQHPDPECRQMRVLQAALRRLMRGQGAVPLDYVTETVTTAQPLAMKEFHTTLFLWYDYFSIPQESGCQQAEAIKSIPGYVAKCRFFLVLCPFLESGSGAHVLSALTWSRRGGTRKWGHRQTREMESFFDSRHYGALGCLGMRSVRDTCT